ncbi:demethoxyubiquinone hydroxylase family protein [Mitsuaria sp. GD03876]|uniref:demethoxyubiquinone hydroxylase family protein n=1 Tax=Mitsuaria sp. GD03876 TaxID=2975399 RepID=UPI00244B8558|nr:demethoxyubiquinone hydroxylase family protein [Mitsuaria sp. GD03876]MDH0867544.1 demethoxyubiquinone hydroxylase family protein [Mitsuaria sp. GD03876]
MKLIALPRPADSLAERTLKVNHAGEHGAVNIYAGQRLVAQVTCRSLLDELAEFQSHEEKHRAIFQAELERRGVRRCRSYLLCGVGGYTLGVITALFGRSAIAATTVAVERVVLGHLKHQLRDLAGVDDAAVVAISSIVQEEQQHHDSSAAHFQGRARSFWLRMLTPVVSASTETVIWLGMRL